MFQLDNLQVVRHTNWIGKRELNNVRSVWSAQIVGNTVTFPGMDAYDSALDKKDWDEANPTYSTGYGYTSMPTYTNFIKFKPFFKVIGRQQAILKALTEDGGLWRSEERDKSSYQSATKVRDLLDTSEAFLRQITELATTLHTGANSYRFYRTLNLPKRRLDWYHAKTYGPTSVGFRRLLREHVLWR